jgi:DNA-binding transcriptional LysR family regulator
VQNPWARRRRIELAELVNEPWTLTAPESLGGAVMQAFRASGLDYPRATLVSDSPEVRLSLVAAGRFLTIAPYSFLRFHTGSAALKVLPVELPMDRLPVVIATLKNRTLSPAAKLFIQHAREAAKLLAKRK